MGFERLYKNLIDIIKEEQAKLGFRREAIRLYYPLSSLNHFFETEYSEEEMLNISKIDFTVKGHKEYKGTKQTDVTRCKFVKEVKEEDIANVQCDTVDEALNMFFESIEA